MYAEGVNGQRLAEEELITKDNNIIKYTAATRESN